MFVSIIYSSQEKKRNISSRRTKHLAINMNSAVYLNFNSWPIAETIRCSSKSILLFLLSDRLPECQLATWKHKIKTALKFCVALWPSSGQWNITRSDFWNTWEVTLNLGSKPFYFSSLLPGIGNEDTMTGPPTATSDKETDEDGR